MLFVPSKSAVSASPGPLEVLQSNPTGIPWGLPSPFAGSPVWEAWCGAQNIHNSQKTSFVLLFSNLWVTHLVRMRFYFILIVPILLCCSGFSFVFGHGVLFSGGFQCPPVDGCSTASFDFNDFTGGDDHMSFYSTILIWSPKGVLFITSF